jgi:hypothetical protein
VSDRGTVVTPTVTNSKLAMQFEASQAYIKKLKEDIADLKAKMKVILRDHIPAKTTNNDTYCWSHGYQVHKDHTSATCKAQKNRHKTEATKSNTMGRFKWGK